MGECDLANSNDADGIGLVRTEILFINYKEMPDEKEQYSQYADIIKKMKNRPVTIRTVDAAEDKIFTGYTSKMSVTKEGLRGIGYSLSQKDTFIVQIRAVLRAAQDGDVGVMFPMVNNIDEIKEAKALIGNESSQINQDKRENVTSLKIGAVVESKESVRNIDDILEEVDFISIGTNDLLQQITGMSRSCFTDDGLSYLKPDFLETIQYCIGQAKSKGKPVSICGEMASDPVAAVLLWYGRR
jgi:phosphotransferase system enzyme I (PtsI)